MKFEGKNVDKLKGYTLFYRIIAGKLYNSEEEFDPYCYMDLPDGNQSTFFKIGSELQTL